MADPTKPPFTQEQQLNDELQHPLPLPPRHSSTPLTIPDQPCLPLSDTIIAEFLAQELATPTLDALYPHLWLVAAQFGDHIDALHKHVTKGRRIVVTEDAKLHLVWARDIVFVKPIPPSLLNYAFWQCFLCSSTPSTRTLSFQPTALGFLRSYAYLIRHRSDFQLAVDTGLIPATTDWPSMARFLACFRSIPDTAVARRYHYGQFRLSRLNYAVRLCWTANLPSHWYYHQKYWHTAAYIERFFAPLLFVFASASIVTSAQQVVLTIPENTVLNTHALRAFQLASYGSSVTLLLTVAIVWSLVLLGVPALLASQLAYAVRTKREKRIIAIGKGGV